MAPVDRTVLVTGAGTGIGLAAIVELARRGFRGVAGVRTPAKARAVTRAARKAGARLKLETQKRPTPVLVIDHVERKPTDN